MFSNKDGTGCEFDIFIYEISRQFMRFDLIWEAGQPTTMTSVWTDPCAAILESFGCRVENSLNDHWDHQILEDGHNWSISAFHRTPLQALNTILSSVQTSEPML